MKLKGHDGAGETSCKKSNGEGLDTDAVDLTNGQLGLERARKLTQTLQGKLGDGAKLTQEVEYPSTYGSDKDSAHLRSRAWNPATKAS